MIQDTILFFIKIIIKIEKLKFFLKLEDGPADSQLRNHRGVYMNGTQGE